MKTELPNLLGAAIRDYFTDHLPRLRGTSPHTIHSYRDSLVLLLRFLSRQRNKPVTALDHDRFRYLENLVRLILGAAESWLFAGGGSIILL